jgi:hypothetical protein
VFVFCGDPRIGRLSQSLQRVRTTALVSHPKKKAPLQRGFF